MTTSTPKRRDQGPYGKLASVYELTLGERLLYADARRRAIKSRRLSLGVTVVDVACGTGFNFPLIQERIGPSGTLIRVDLTAGMLDRARARVQRAGWSNVKLVQLDATSLTGTQLERADALAEGKEVDAVLYTLGMSLIPEWKAAWEAMVALVSTRRHCRHHGRQPAAPTNLQHATRPPTRLDGLPVLRRRLDPRTLETGRAGPQPGRDQPGRPGSTPSVGPCNGARSLPVSLLKSGWPIRRAEVNWPTCASGHQRVFRARARR
jgi:SAM-dependent methyltransferase